MRAPSGDDRGSGLVGTIGAVVVFLSFLLFAVQLLVGLYGRSVVTSAAYDGARLVAGRAPSDRDAALVDGEARVRAEVGALPLRLDWTGTDDDHVVLRVQADNPRFLLPGLAGPLATDHIDRTVVVRVERVR